MSSFEINKIMGSIFSVILLLLIIKNLSSILYPIQKVTEHNNLKSTPTMIPTAEAKPPIM